MEEFSNKTGACIIDIEILPVYNFGAFSRSDLVDSEFKIKGTRS
jgi:hypothetical protein